MWGSTSVLTNRELLWCCLGRTQASSISSRHSSRKLQGSYILCYICHSPGATQILKDASGGTRNLFLRNFVYFQVSWISPQILSTVLTEGSLNCREKKKNSSKINSTSLKNISIYMFVLFIFLMKNSLMSKWVKHTLLGPTNLGNPSSWEIVPLVYLEFWQEIAHKYLCMVFLVWSKKRNTSCSEITSAK